MEYSEERIIAIVKEINVGRVWRASAALTASMCRRSTVHGEVGSVEDDMAPKVNIKMGFMPLHPF